jgi:hypothetical protein
MSDVKRTVRGQRTMAKNSIPAKMHTHPHTNKALKAVAINSGFKKKSSGGTGNGLSSADIRY